ncbi:MAG TPA: hypothetical protein VLH79_04330 [Chthonomonadales bacterium]|nr:hypothetical protein [Chthonomonadales bacterium]
MLRAAAPLALLLALSVAPAPGQVRAPIDARGVVPEVRVGDAVYLLDVAAQVVKPGWSGAVAEQTAAAGSGNVARRGNVSVADVTVVGDGATVRFRTTARVEAGRVVLVWQVTPDRDVQAESVLVRGSLPVEGNAGITRFVATGADVVRGTLPTEPAADAHLLVGGGLREWVGLGRPGSPALRVSVRGAGTQLQDDRRFELPRFTLMAAAPGGRLRGGESVRIELALAPATLAGLEADARRIERGGLAGMDMTDRRPLRVGRVTADRTRLPALETAELTIDLAATYDNPFDPDQIAVDADVRGPGGRRWSVPGFFKVPMRLETLDSPEPTRRTGRPEFAGFERLAVAGRPGFRVRFTPRVPGVYRVTVRVQNRGRVARAAPIVLTAGPARTRDGFLGISRRSPRHFAFPDGRPFIPVGLNVCWAGGPSPLAAYEAWFRGLGAAGGNWARLWLAFNEKGLEWMPAPTPKPGTGTFLGLGRYAQDNAWRLDQVVRLARENGLFLMLCFGTYGEFTVGGFFGEGSWVSNPYNAANGGPCARPEDFWTDPKARSLYKRRLRYLVARWGHAPNLFAWQFWNEIPPTPAQERWNSEMAAHLKGIDPYGHLVSTTFGSDAVWRCPNIDFTMTHMYGQAGNTADFTERIVRETRALRAHPKPYLLAEFGIDWQGPCSRWDPRGTGVNLHNGAWAALLAGGAGTAMNWWWDSYIHPNNLYRILTPVRRFADAVAWTEHRLEPVDGIVVEGDPRAPETFDDLTVPAEVEWGATPSTVYTVRRDGRVAGGPVAATIGSVQRGRAGELHTRLTWRVDMPAAGRATLRLGSVCTHARLVVRVNGQTRVDRELAAGPPGEGPWKSAHFLERYGVWVSDYDEDIPLDLSSGPSEIVVENAAGDWLQIRSLHLPAYRSSRFPHVNALGLADDRLLLLWVHNRDSTWRTDYEGRQPGTLRGLTVTTPAAAGRWAVEWWDTWTGRVVKRETAEARDGLLRLSPPDFARDLAVRAVRQ